MLFLWTTTELGKIWLDGDAVKQIAERRLPQELYVQEVSFIGEKALLNIYVASPEDSPASARAGAEEKLSAIFAPAGVNVQINWVSIAPHDNRKTTPIWTLPTFWAVAAASAAALFHMGITGVLWSIFFAVIGYGISWLILTEDGQKQINALRELFRR